MPVYKSTKPTKDGRAWFYKVQYPDQFNNIKVSVSKMYSTKTEAKDAERLFLNKIKDKNQIPSKMTIGDLWNSFLEYQDSRVRISTKRGYIHTAKYIEPLFKVKCTDLDLKTFEAWLDDLRKKDNLNIVSKNDKLKVFRAVLNFGRKQYNFDFNRVLSTPSRFKNPGAVRVEHNVFTLEEFNQFLSVEDDLRFQCLWKTLYYCGLRIGEARGLQWKDIDWNAKSIWIKKQVQSIDNCAGNWFMCDLKTKSSYRHLPLCETLLNDLKMYHDQVIKFTNYSDDFFIFGTQFGVVPISHCQAQRRKSANCKKAEVKEIRLHDFRHSCASLLIHSGVPIPEVSRYLGHASLTETLNTYSHMFKSDFMNIATSINNVVNE